ncbi:hypothetical protein K432DRAFT_385861 [Lepidopterella palustris CBS 459.81]|uniref:Uncharacterized protein n=1 Tax=Lepidopterella palustris CBS 459.81 TaxID=1314670 RepID=A0A8E2E2A2_9PEZI|nr:hypothetical protein K432DRAFT_385861 [Lepidopterella palustris CBS 459.81]
MLVSIAVPLVGALVKLDFALKLRHQTSPVQTQTGGPPQVLGASFSFLPGMQVTEMPRNSMLENRGRGCVDDVRDSRINQIGSFILGA